MNDKLDTLRDRMLDAIYDAVMQYRRTSQGEVTSEENCAASLMAVIGIVKATAVELEWSNAQIEDIWDRALRDIIRLVQQQRQAP